MLRQSSSRVRGRVQSKRALHRRRGRQARVETLEARQLLALVALDDTAAVVVDPPQAPSAISIDLASNDIDDSLSVPWEAGNIKVVENDTGNATGAATTSLPQRTPNFFLRDTAPGDSRAEDRGDYEITIGDTHTDDFASGLLITSVANTLRDHGNNEGPQVGIASSTVDSDGSYFISQHRSDAGTPEYNVDIDAVWLPWDRFADHGIYLGAVTNESVFGNGTNNNGPMITDRYNYPTGGIGVDFIDSPDNSGEYTFRIPNPAGGYFNPHTDGVILVTGLKNDDNFAIASPNADNETWTVLFQDITTPSRENDGIGWAFIPNNTPLVTAGRVAGDGTILSTTSGSFTTTDVGEGQVYLEIAGGSPAAGSLLTTPDGAIGSSMDENVITFEPSGGGWIVSGLDVTGTGGVLEDVGSDPMFTFAYFPHGITDSPIEIQSVDTTGTQGSVTINPDNVTVTYEASPSQVVPVGQTVVDTFTYTAVNTVNTNETSTAMVTVRLSNPNDPPTIVGNLPPVSVQEDAANLEIDIADLFADPDLIAGDVLSINASSLNPLLVSADVSGDTLTLRFGENQFGATYVSVLASDLAGATAELSFRVSVAPVEDSVAGTPDARLTTKQTAINIPVLANDLHPDAVTVIENHGFNIEVTQNDAGNATGSINIGIPERAAAVPQASGGAGLRAGSNRGDYNVQLGAPNDDTQSAVLLTSVRENGRSNELADNPPNMGGPGLRYATSAIEDSGTNGYYIPVFATKNAAGDPSNNFEFNANIAAAFFPLAEGYIAGHSRGNTLMGSPDLRVDEHFIFNGDGTYTLDLPGVSGPSEGVMLVTGGSNASFMALSKANPDGTYTIYSKRNNTDGPAYAHNDVAFTYIPNGTPGVISGRVNSDAGQLVASGAFTTTADGLGRIRLSIPGHTPASGTLIISPEGGDVENVDNFVSYQADGNDWIIEVRDAPDDMLVDLAAVNEPTFSFAFLPFDTLDPGTALAVTSVQSPSGTPAVSQLGASVTLLADGTVDYDPSGSAELQLLTAGESATDTFTYTLEDGRGDSTQVTVTVRVFGASVQAVADSAVTSSGSTVVIGGLANDTNFNAPRPARSVAAAHLDVNSAATTAAGSVYTVLQSSPAPNNFGIGNAPTLGEVQITLNGESVNPSSGLTIASINENASGAAENFRVVVSAPRGVNQFLEMDRYGSNAPRNAKLGVAHFPYDAFGQLQVLEFQQGLEIAPGVTYEGVLDGAIVRPDAYDSEDPASPQPFGDFDSPNIFLDLTGSTNSHGLFRFDDFVGNGPGQIPPGTQITSASFVITTSVVGNAQSPGPFYLHEVRVPWDETATQINSPFFDDFEFGLNEPGEIGPAIAEFRNIAQGQVIAVDATSIVQNWINGGPNNGFGITPGTTDGWSVEFSESLQQNRPMLRIVLDTGAQVEADWLAGTISADGSLQFGNPQVTTSRLQNGNFHIQIPGVTDSYRQGLLFAIGNDTNDDNTASATAVGGNAWEIIQRDQTTTRFSAGEDGSMGFVYLPWTTSNLVAGRVDASFVPATPADPMPMHQSAGEFTMTREGLGRYRLNIPGTTPTEGMLLLTPANYANGTGEMAFLSYQADGDDFIIQSHHQPSTELIDVDFAFALVPFTDTLQPGVGNLSISSINGSPVSPGSTVTLPSNARVTLGPDGSFSYDPNGQYDTLAFGQTATDTFSYTVTDGPGSSTAAVTLTIVGENKLEVANPLADVVATQDDADLVIDISSVFNDPEGHTLSYSLDVANSQYLTAELNGNLLTLDFNPRRDGIAFVTLTADDGFGGRVAEGFKVTVNPVTVTRPLIENETAATDEATPIFGIDVLANDIEMQTAPRAYGARLDGDRNVTDAAGAWQVAGASAAPYNIGLLVDNNNGDPVIGLNGGELSQLDGFNMGNFRGNVSSPEAPASVEGVSGFGTVLGLPVGRVGYATSLGSGGEGEINVPISSAWFPFDNGFVAGHFDLGYQIYGGNGIRNEDLRILNSGLYEISLPFVSDSRSDGYLFGIPMGNNDNLISIVPQGGSSWQVKQFDNDTDTFGAVNGRKQGEDNPFSVMYVPGDYPGLIAGRIDNNGNILQQSGSFSVDAGNSGEWEITIPGEGPSTGVMIVNVAGVDPLDGEPAGAIAYYEEEFNAGGDRFLLRADYVDTGSWEAANTTIQFMFIPFVDETELATLSVSEAVSAAGALVSINPDGTLDYDPNGQFDHLNFGETATDTVTYTVTNGQGSSYTGTVTVTINGIGGEPTEPQELYLNEIMANAPGADGGREYLEIRGEPGSTIANGTYLVSIDGDGSAAGVLDHVFDLSGMQIGSNGYLVLLQAGTIYSGMAAAGANVVEATGSGWGLDFSSRTNDLENGSNTFMLIETFTPPVPDVDLDADNDGLLDDESGWRVLDSIGVLDGGAADTAYGAINYSSDGAGVAGGPIVNAGFLPGYFARRGDSTGAAEADWVVSLPAGAVPDWLLPEATTLPSELEGAPIDHLGASNAFAAEVNQPPVLTAAAGQTLDEGGALTAFSLATFTDADAGDTHTATIDWGDGSAPEAGTVDQAAGTITGSHTYLDDGVYTVTVTIDDGEASDSGTLTVTVANLAPTLALTGAGSVNEGASYSLMLGAVVDPGDDTVTQYVVDWGDGSSDTYTTAGLKSHVYADGPADYTIVVDLVDEDGTHNAAGTLAVTVDNVAPTVNAGSNLAVNTGGSVALAPASFTDPGDDTHTATIDWGDGSAPASGVVNQAAGTVSGSHVFAAAGVYTVTVTVNDGQAAGTDTFTVTVADSVNLPPTVTAASNQTRTEGSPLVDLVVATFTDADSSSHTATIDWGDGSPLAAGTVNQATGAVSGSHTWLDNGVYTVTVTVDDGDGNLTADSFTVTVTNVPPTALISGPTSGSPGDSLTFSFSAADPSPTDAANLLYEIDWNNDGLIDHAQTAGAAGFSLANTFAAAGSVTIRLVVTDPDGGSGVDTHNVTVVDDAEPVVLVDGDLIVTGGGSSDRIILSSVGAPGLIRVRYNNDIYGPFPVEGNVYVYGRGGGDTIVANIGLPLIADGGDGNDYIAGTSFDDTLSGGEGNDVILAGEGNNFVDGGDGNDRLEGRDGVDVIFGGPGNDRINGGAGDDVLDGGDGNDYVFGGEGDDLLLGGRGIDNLNGHFGNDVLLGGDDSDQLFGGPGHDLLIGGRGSDRLRGDAGDDDLIGGVSQLDAALDDALAAMLASLGSSLAETDAAVAAAVDLWFSSGGVNRSGFGELDDVDALDELTGGSGADEFHGNASRIRDFRSGEQMI